MNVREEIIDALTEAKILEHGRDKYDAANVLFTASNLSGAPISWVTEIANELKFSVENPYV